MRHSTPLILILLVFLWACQGSPASKSGKAPVDSNAEILKLKEGMQIVLAHQALTPNSAELGQEKLRTLSLDSAGGAQGVSLTWRAQAPEPKTGAVRLLPVVASGSLSLPNVHRATQMTLPALWPAGDLYLAGSSGLWLSDSAFAELKKKRKALFEPGLLNKAILGMAQDFKWMEQGLQELNQDLKQDSKLYEKLTQLKAKRIRQNYTLKLNGRKKEVKVIQAESPLARYKILDHVQNPLVLDIILFPQASIAELLFSPRIWMKGLLEYHVVGIYTPD